MNGEHMEPSNGAERQKPFIGKKLPKAFKKIHHEGYKPPRAKI